MVRYKGQIHDLDKKGFFVMDDGSKSSDHIAKLKKRSKKSEGTDGKPSKKQKKEKAAADKKAAEENKPAE